MPDIPVVFAHGMEGSPNGTKGTYLRREFQAHAPWLGELELDGQVRALEETIGETPCVLVGSSLGGLAALGLTVGRPELVSHLILLAPAVGMHRHAAAHVHECAHHPRPGLWDQSAQFSRLKIPTGTRATIIHGFGDEVIDVDDVLNFARRSPGADLILVHDDHSLRGSEALIISVVGRSVRGQYP